MDLTQFIYSKKYIRLGKQYELRFDFDLKIFNGRNQKTFEHYKSLLHYLEENSEKQIYVTETQVADFLEIGDALVIGLKSYQEFCKMIGQNSKNRTQAFLAHKVKRYSGDELREIIGQTPGDEIVEAAKELSVEQKDEIVKANVTAINILEIINTLDEDLQKQIWESLKPLNGNDGEKIITISATNAEGIFVQIANAENKDLVVANLRKLEKENFENLQHFIGIAKVDNILEEWGKNKNNNDEKYWQKLFEDNAWILQQVFSYPVIILQGETYVGGKNTKGRNGQGGVATDFLGQDQSTNSFAVIEIKNPMANLVGPIYRGEKDSGLDNESYSIGAELSGGIVQLENQMNTAIRNFETTIGENFREQKINYLNPHGVLIIGSLDSLTEAQKKSFFLFRKSIKDVSIITFGELFEKITYLKHLFND